MLVLLIAACEIGFWVMLAAGLLARYGLKWPRVGAAFLLCVPLVDLVLLGATVIDLRGGASATAAHGLAAAYLGFSVAFGHQLITQLDARAAHRFAGGPAPVAPPRRGPGRLRHAWDQWRRAAAAWAVACGLLSAAILVVDNPDRTAELASWVLWLSAALLLWLLLGPVLTYARESQRRPDTRVAGARTSDENASPDETGAALEHPTVRAQQP